MISFHFVDVATIRSEVPRSQFLEADLDRLADLILDSGGLVKPITIKQVGIDDYLVIDGDFEYYAAVRAKEKDSSRGEMVNAFLVKSKNEATVKEQAKFIIKEPSPTVDNPNFERRINSLELRFEKQNNEFRTEYQQEIKNLQDRIKEVENLIPTKNDPLALLNQLNRQEIAIKLQRARINGAEKIAKNIVEARQKKPNQLFQNYRDVVTSVSGLGDKIMLTIIDEWNR
jgi:hypothetical protein